MFHPEVSIPYWLHLYCIRVESSILVLVNKPEENENNLLSLLGVILLV